MRGIVDADGKPVKVYLGQVVKGTKPPSGGRWRRLGNKAIPPNEKTRWKRIG